MIFNGKRINKDKFIQLLNEGLPSIDNYEWMKDLIVKQENMLDFSNDCSGRKTTTNYHERCFCVINEFKEALVFRYFMIRVYRKDGVHFREIHRNVYINGKEIELMNGRFYFNYEWRWTKDDREWKYKTPGYYDTNHISCDHLLIADAPKFEYVKIMFECMLRYCSNSQIEKMVLTWLNHPKHEILWKANGKKFSIINKIDGFSSKKLHFMGKNQLEEHSEVIRLYDYYNVDFIRKIKQSYKLENVIEELEKYKIDKFQLARFIKKQEEFDCGLYFDYLENLKELNIDIKTNAFPKDYEEEHINLSLRIQALKKDTQIKKYNKQYTALSETLINFERTGRYKVIVPKTLEDYLREGTIQRICLFANGYYKNVIKHESLILFIRQLEKPNRPYVTVELDNKFNVVQARAFKNDPAPKEVNDYLEEVTKDYRNQFINLDNFWKSMGLNKARAI